MTQNNISPSVRRFNSMVAEFDTLTGGKFDTASPEEIFWQWLKIDAQSALAFAYTCAEVGERFEANATPQADNDAK